MIRADKEAINKYLTEEVLKGKHWNSIGNKHYYFIPDFMGYQISDPELMLNFFTNEGCMRLWLKIQEMDWFEDFFDDLNGMVSNEFYWARSILRYFIRPDRLAPAVYRFLKEKEKN